MKPLGFGQLTGIDLENERRGVLPSQEWKRSTYKKPEQQKWYAGETISVGIGQGYNSFTPLQLAHAVSNLSNNGVVMKPHLVKMVESGTTKVRKLTVQKESYRIPLKQDNIDFIKQAMIGVTKEGTSARSFANAPYVSGGKTGTAQAAALSRSVKYDASKISERLRDHSLYIAFAPADKPRIALAVIVENAGFGAAAAAPIARMAMDYYLTGKRPDEPAKPVVKVSDNPAQPDATKPDATKPDAIKLDATKPEIVKSSAKTDAIKAEATKPSAKPADPSRGAPQ
jgi:penicillin-binding protein 2